MDPDSFFADPDPDSAVLLNADPDPAVFAIRIRIQLLFLLQIQIRLLQFCKKLPYEEFLELKKTITKMLTSKKPWRGPIVLTIVL